MNQKISIIGIMLVVLLGNCTQQSDFPVLKGPYLGQKPPGMTSEIFAPGIISTEDEPEMNAAFTCDGKEFYFSAFHYGSWSIFVTKETNGVWTKPAPLPFSSEYTDRDLNISPDGKKIYFGSNRPRSKGGEILPSLDIYFIEKLESGAWSEPQNAGMIINSDFNENYPSIASTGNLYFFSKRDDGIGLCDIYTAAYVNGRYQPPRPLDRSVNSVKNDWDAYIAPDESYIIFSSQNRDDTIGKQDLYISFKDSNKEWTKAVNMGPSVNSSDDEICPSVSLDGKYLFFTTRRRGAADIYWVDAKIIEELKPDEFE